MPGQGTHLVAGLEAMERCPYIKKLSEKERMEFMLGNIIVDTVTPNVGGRWQSHFIEEAGWDIPETFEDWKQEGFQMNGFGEDHSDLFIVGPEVNLDRVLVLVKSETEKELSPFRIGYLFHLLVDFFNQKIRFNENYEWRPWQDTRVRINRTGEVFNKNEFKSKTQLFYPMEEAFLFESFGVSETNVNKWKNFFKSKLNKELYGAQIEKYLRYLKQPFEENPFVNKEQLVRIIDISCMFLNNVLCFH